MKLSRMLMVLLGAASIAACSKNAQIDEPVIKGWENDSSQPAPIEFGRIGGFDLETKASVVGDALYNVPFGIYSLDLNDNTPLLNKLAQCESTEQRLQFVQSLGGEEIQLYYPIESKHNYTFYGYHIGSEDIAGQSESGGGAFFKTVDLDDIDVLWAKSVATPIETASGTVYGFNSKYSRTARKQPNFNVYYPQLNFAHVTTSFHIYVKAFDAEAAASFLEDKVRVTSVCLTNVDAKAKLIICDKNNPEREGTLESLGEAKVDLLHENLNVVPTYSEIGNGTEISDGFFVLPGSYSDSKLKFTLDTDPEGGPTTYEVSLPTPSGTETFEKGKSYSFVIIIKSFEQIIIKASVQDWVDGFSAEDEGMNVIKEIE